MQELNLPADFITFLQRDGSLTYGNRRCETGFVTLFPLSELAVEVFNLQTYATPLEEDDPNVAQAGVYRVPAVSLLKTCEHYLPHFHLVWLPEEQKFGSGDEEHGHLIVFPNASWTDIVANPIPYLEAQWNEGGQFGEYLRPWDKYPYAVM